MVQAGLFYSVLANFLLWIPTFLVIVPLATGLWLYHKTFTYLVTKYLKPNYRPPNNVMDFSMCLGSSSALPNTNCGQIWVLSGKWINAHEFSSHFYNCFLATQSDGYKNLLARLTTFGTYCFYAHCAPEQLDLSWHIREYPLAKFGCGTLESFAAVWMTTDTYEENRPVWQIAIVHLGDAQQMETGIVAKFSHALVDGYSLIHMIGKLVENPAPYNVKDRTFTWKEKLKFVMESPEQIVSRYCDMAFSRNSRSPYKKSFRLGLRCFSGSMSCQPQWFMSLTTLNLETVRMIRKITDSHFICVMIAAQFGALRKLMLESREESSLPEYMWLGTSLPWGGHPHSFTNHWTMGYFKCPMRLADRLERLRCVEADFRHYKQLEADTKLMLMFAPILRMLPAPARRIFLKNDFALKNASVFCASLMLSPTKHYLLGREVKCLYLPLACADVAPIGLYCVSTSHSGKIDLSISACAPVVQTQDELDRVTKLYFMQELDSLVTCCGALRQQ